MAAPLRPLAAHFESARNRWEQLRFSASTSPALSALLLLLCFAGFAASGLSLLAIGQILGSVSVPGRADSLTRGIALLTGALLATPLTEAAVAVASKRLEQLEQTRRADQLARALLAPPTIQHLEDPARAAEAAGLIEQSRSWQILRSTSATISVVQSRIAALAPLLILLAWRPVLAVGLLALFALLSAVSVLLMQNVYLKLDTSTEAQRLQRYMYTLASGEGAAREVRLFGLLPWIRPALAGFEHGQKLPTHDLAGSRSVTLIGLATGIACTLAVLVAVHDATAGTVDAAQVAVLTAAIAGMLGWGPLGDPQPIMAIAGAYQRRANALERALTAAPQQPIPPATDHGTGDAAGSTPRPTASESGPGRGAISVRSAAYRYPGRSEDVLRSIDLDIAPGQSVGIVGVNGAGKSTLMSLLAGLDAPSAGAVEIDGRSARAPEDGQPRVAVILQDFARYPLSLRDNIALGRSLPDDRIRELIDRAGGAGILARLDAGHHGLDTILAPGYEDGTDLSGGQWQRLAIARALAALEAGARVLILDEPTSALDVRAEAALFEDFLEITRGTTTLLVSHRLSSVRHADRIVVIGDGTVIQDGSHEDLMAAGGPYAEMFSLQARRFAQAGDLDA